MIRGLYCCKTDGYWVYSLKRVRVFLVSHDTFPPDDPEVGSEVSCWYNEETQRVVFDDPN